jgi:GTPase involved in cell partitioning and DNA repair
MGKNGGKTLLRVPSGTLVFELNILEDKESKHLLADLSKDK